MPLSVGLVGAGVVTEALHAPAFRRSKETSFYAVCDSDSARRAKFPVKQYADYRDLIADPKVELVGVCVPASLHRDVALAALAAGKPVLIEKPLALTLEDCDAIISAAGSQVAAVGFNQRLSPAMERLKQQIHSGTYGTVQMIRTTWTHRLDPYNRSWHYNRERGGGALMDLGAHQLDLWRFLLDDEIVETFAVSNSSILPDQSVVLTARFRRGALCTAVLSMTAQPRYEIEVVGTGGRTQFNGYDQFSDSYVRQWDRMASAIRNGTPVAATLADGRESLRWILHAAAHLQQEPPRPKQPYAMSVVLGTDRTIDALRSTIRHLGKQTIANKIELVLVGCEHKLEPEPELIAPFATHQIVYAQRPISLGKMNATGMKAARGEVIALGEDHCFPKPDWAEQLLRAHEGPWAMVGPHVENGNPGTVASWVDYALGYADWSDPSQGGLRPYLPGHNSSFKRRVVEEYFPDLENWLSGFEFAFHLELNRRGHMLLYEPRAVTRHMNFSKPSSLVAVHYPGGRLFAAIRSRHWSPAKRWFYALASTGFTALRAWRIVRFWTQSGRKKHWILPGFPILLTALVVDSAGQCVGYLFGAGNSAEKQIQGEYHRIDNVVDADRKLWE